MIATADFSALPRLRYRTIYADPPWQFDLRSERGEGKSPQAHYDTMQTAEIAAMPVGHLAAGDCLLWLWCTAPMLRDGLRVLDGWGFRYCSMGAWAKRSSTGRSWHFGPGYVLRSAVEPFLIGTIGAPRILSHSVRNLLDDPVREHSRKPESAYDALEALTDGPRLELFARRRRPGWDAFGNEIAPEIVPESAAEGEAA